MKSPLCPSLFILCFIVSMASVTAFADDFSANNEEQELEVEFK